ncbi:MAG: DMT family transporter [Betaproteobacteria bacterium]|nr:DMT family transporter [Betaproteobacteria bacterium]
MASPRHWISRAALLTGAWVWGLIWYPYRVLEAMGASAALATCLTYGLALALGIVAFPRALREARAHPWMVLAIALAAGWTNFAYVLGTLRGEVMRVLLLFYLAPFWTVLLSRVLLSERTSLQGCGVLGLSVAGAAVMLWHPETGAPLPRTVAEWLGLSAGMCFALSNVLIRKAQALGIEIKGLTVWGGVTLITLAWETYGGGLAAVTVLPGNAWMLLALVGLVIFAVNLAVQFGVTFTPANQAIVIFMTELVVAAVAAYLLAGEQMSPQEWVGGAMIAAASLFSGRMMPKAGSDAG